MNKPLFSTTTYPYEDRDGLICHFNRRSADIKDSLVKSCKKITGPSNKEAVLLRNDETKRAILQFGPVVTDVNWSSELRAYKAKSQSIFKMPLIDNYQWESSLTNNYKRD